MNENDRRVVYSTEDGSLQKAMPNNNKSRRTKKRQAPQVPAKGGIRIHRESKGRGGKCVSIIVGLPLTEVELKALLKQFKSRLGTGGAVKQGCIEIQGDRREQLLELLAEKGHQAKLAGG